MEDGSRPARSRPGAEATLSRELADFLVELSIVLHKRAIYPAGHPFLRASADRFADRLEVLLELRESVMLGVARDRLVIESATTDPGNALLRDLAHRLHRHQLASIGFTRGATADEVEGLLAALSSDPEKGDGPLGRRLSGMPGWPHIELRSAGYDRLALREDTGDARPERDFWLELAQAALDMRNGKGAPDGAEPLIVTESADRDKGEAAYDSVVLGYLSQVAEEQSGRAGVGEERLRRRVSRLLSALDPETLQRLLQTGADHTQRQQPRLGGSQALAVDAVVSVLESAAKSSDHNISHNLLRLLYKLALQTKEGSAPTWTEADGALRRSVAQLISDWQLADPNPGGYTAMLEGMVREIPNSPPYEAETRCDPELILRMGVELGSAGPRVCAAAETLSQNHQLARAAAILDGAPESDATREIWRHVATPTRLRSELEASTPDHGAVAILATHLAAEAAGPLLDALERATGRSSRAALLKHLLALGPGGVRAAAARLPGAPWYFQRNILVLIGQAGAWPEGFTPLPWATEGDVRVRREAIKLLIASSAHRDSAILLGLRDPDHGIVALALAAAGEACPPEALSLIEQIAVASDRDSKTRVQAVRVLARAPADVAVPRLAALALSRRPRWFGRPLAAKSPELLAAITGLAGHSRDEPQAAAVLAFALRHPDPEIRQAAGGAA